MTRRRVAAVLSIVLLTSALSCHHRHSPAPCRYDEQLALAVAPSVTPTFTWSPACTLGHIYVERVSDRAAMYWGVMDPSNSVRSGVRYGWMPPGRTPYAFASLQPGTTYRAYVGMIIGGDAVAMLRDVTFTP